MRLRAMMTASAVLGMSVLAASGPAAGAATVQTTNDPLSAKQWGISQVKAPGAWASSTGEQQVIAVVDSGVDLTHPDLQSKLVPGATFVGCGPNPAPCGNGSWVGTDGTGQPADSHGSHVAGIAAAATGNGVGIAGVAPNAAIMPIKALDDGSGSFEEVGAGIRYAADHGADVINLSVGSLPGAQLLTLVGFDKATKDAVAYARQKGVVVVAAAGNETAPLCSTPAWETGPICVTATDPKGSRAAYSNFGINPDLKAVAAPGGAGIQGCDEDVWSTVPRGIGPGECGAEGYDALAGTSMAAPHVAGVAALLTAQGRNADGVEAALMNTAVVPGNEQPGSYHPLYGYGIVDADAAVHQPQ